MENSNQMKKIEKIIALSVFAFLVIFVVAIFSFVEVGKARRKNAKYDSFIVALQTQKSSLESDIEEMKDEDYLNEQARDHLGMIKDGETLYIYK